MSVWAIENVTAETEPAELGAAGVMIKSFRKVSQAPDVMQISVDGDFDGAASFSFGDQIVIHQDEVSIFRGKVTSTPRLVSGGQESVDYTIEGPWKDLEERPFLQTWKEYNSGVVDGKRSRVLLGMANDGTLISTGVQIDAVLAYAIGLGDPLAIGDILTGFLSLTEEVRDASCAEVIRRLLQWHPDAATWFDYSMDPPVIHIQRRNDLTEELRALASLAPDMSFVSREDRVPSCVAFLYERTNTTDNGSYVTIERQIYPVDKTGAESRAITATIPLRGLSVSRQAQRIGTKDIPPTGANDLATENWWKRKVPWLSGYNTDNLLVGNHAVLFAREVDPPGSVGEPLPDSTDPADYPRELIDGSTEEWTGFKTARLLVSAVVAYNGDTTEESRKHFTEQIQVGGIWYPAAIVYYECDGTDATTGLHIKQTAWDPGEPTPTGMAQAYYEGLSSLEWEGHIVIENPEADLDLAPGKTLSVTGSALSALGSMTALIQGADYDLELGTVRVSFGPPEQLSPQDFLEAHRIVRRREVARYSERERTEAEPPGGASIVVGGYQHGRSNTSSAPALAPRKHDWAVTPTGNAGFIMEAGYFFGNGLTYGDSVECVPSGGPQYTATGVQELWVEATIVDGQVTAVETNFRAADYDPEEVAGSKAAWHVLTVTLTSGKIDVEYFMTGPIHYGGGAAALGHPFETSFFQVGDPAVWHVRFRYGRQYGDFAVGAEPIPELGGTPLDDAPSFAMGGSPANGLWRAWLKTVIPPDVDVVGETADVIVLNPSESDPVDTIRVVTAPGEAGTAGEYYREISRWTVADNVPLKLSIQQSMFSNIEVMICVSQVTFLPSA